MVRATVMDIEQIPGSDRKRVRGIILFGYRETLLPQDVRLNRLDWIQLEPRSLSSLNASGSSSGAYLVRAFAMPVGSVYTHGVIGSVTTSPPMQSILQGAGGGLTNIGSPALLLWLIGSSGTRTANLVNKFPGTVAFGSRTAYFTILGA